MQWKRVEDHTLIELSEQGLTNADISRQTGISAVAVGKRLKRIRKQMQPLPESFEKLTDKQKSFCEAVAGGMSKTAAALQVYDCNSRESAKALSSKLMTDPNINDSIQTLLHTAGAGRMVRVSRMAQMINSSDNAASARMIELAAKMTGELVERTEIGFDSNLIRQLIQSLPDKPEAIEAEFTPID